MQKKTRTEYSYLNIIAGVGGYSISIILSLINRMVFTRTLPAAYLGINGLFSNILSMLSLAELGVGGAIVYVTLVWQRQLRRPERQTAYRNICADTQKQRSDI